MIAKGQSDKMASEMEVHMKQRCVIEFLHVEKIAHLLNVYKDQTVDVSIVRRWVVHFSSGDSEVKDKARSRRSCTAVLPWNEEHLEQLFHTNWRIMTMELCTELNIGFNVLKTMVATLEYRKVCARWVPQMFTQEYKEHYKQVCQDLLNQYEAEGDSFLDHIITCDKTWCRHYEPEWKQQSMEWQHVNSRSKKKFKMLPSVGKVTCTVFWDGKRVILLDFLESGKTINSDRYIATLSWRLEFPESGQRRRQPFSCNTITPGPIPVWRPWSTLSVLAGLLYNTYHIVQTWHLLTSICSGQWKMDCAGNIFLATMPSYERETVGHLRWCRFLRAQHAGSCSSLAKVHNQWCQLCRKILFCS